MSGVDQEGFVSQSGLEIFADVLLGLPPDLGFVGVSFHASQRLPTALLDGLVAVRQPVDVGEGIEDRSR